MTTDRDPITRRVTGANRAVAVRAGRAAVTAIALGALAAAGACEPSSATDRKKGLRELREIEARNAKLAPTIPMSERVGCEACPDWCRYEVLNLVPLDELFRDYRSLAERVYDMREEAVEAPGRNKAQRKINILSCIAKRTGPGRARFLAYLDDESPLVQLGTAALALERGLAQDRALAVLERVRSQYPELYWETRVLAKTLRLVWSAELALERDPLRHARQIMQEQASRK